MDDSPGRVTATTTTKNFTIDTKDVGKTPKAGMGTRIRVPRRPSALREVQRLLVTLEPKPGSARPTSPPVIEAVLS